MSGSVYHWATVANTITHLGVTNGGTFSSPQYCPSCQLTFSPSAIVQASSLDAGDIYFDPNSAYQLDCSTAGNYGGGTSGGIPYFVLAYERTAWTGGALSNCQWYSNPTRENCDYPTIPWCDIYSTPPDLDIRTMWDQVYPYGTYNYWDAVGVCFRFNKGDAWICPPGLARGLGSHAPLPDHATCTHRNKDGHP